MSLHRNDLTHLDYGHGVNTGVPNPAELEDGEKAISHLPLI